MLVEIGIETVELAPERGKQPLDALLRLLGKRHARALFLGCNHGNDLPATGKKGCQRLALFIPQRPDLRPFSIARSGCSTWYKAHIAQVRPPKASLCGTATKCR